VENLLLLKILRVRASRHLSLPSPKMANVVDADFEVIDEDKKKS
jgi:hypothetical protein